MMKVLMISLPGIVTSESIGFSQWQAGAFVGGGAAVVAF